MCILEHDDGWWRIEGTIPGLPGGRIEPYVMLQVAAHPTRKDALRLVWAMRFAPHAPLPVVGPRGRTYTFSTRDAVRIERHPSGDRTYVMRLPSDITENQEPLVLSATRDGTLSYTEPPHRFRMFSDQLGVNLLSADDEATSQLFEEAYRGEHNHNHDYERFEKLAWAGPDHVPKGGEFDATWNGERVAFTANSTDDPRKAHRWQPASDAAGDSGGTAPDERRRERMWYSVLIVVGLIIVALGLAYNRGRGAAIAEAHPTHSTLRTHRTRHGSVSEYKSGQ